MPFVLTAEPYHENSTVLGCFSSTTPALDYLKLIVDSKGECIKPLELQDEPEEFVLQHFFGTTPGAAVVVFTPRVSSMEEFWWKPCLHKGKRGEYEPITFWELNILDWAANFCDLQKGKNDGDN